MPPPINKSLRFPPTAYFPGRETKSGIALHHTVGGTAKSTFDYWVANSEKVGTAYIIDRDGTVYEVFEPTAWAWQFGLDWARADKMAFEKRFIGIEIASEGRLIERDGKLYCFDKVSPQTLRLKDKSFDCGKDYRGYRYFDKYEDAQITALCSLVGWLCEEFAIEKRVPANPLEFRGEALKRFNGIIGHTMVRQDKTDPLPDPNFWKSLCATCGLTVVDDVTAAPTSPRGVIAMNNEQLFQENVATINSMNVAAGGMVKSLMMELQRDDRGTYIRLLNPVAGGHVVDYQLVQGDPNLVERTARALGFLSVTGSRLEVRHG